MTECNSTRSRYSQKSVIKVRTSWQLIFLVHKVIYVSLAPPTLPTTFQNPAIASLILKATNKHTDVPALVIQWNTAGFNDVPASPNNRNGVAGQNQNAIINSLEMAGAINYSNTVFVFRESMQISIWERALPNWYEKNVFHMFKIL